MDDELGANQTINYKGVVYNSDNNGTDSDTTGGGGGGGYGSGSGGSSTYTTKTHETNETTDKTTTRNIGDITTTSRTNSDPNAKANLLATTIAQINALKAQQAQSAKLLDSAIADNNASTRQQQLENTRNTNQDWYTTQSKLQSSMSALRSSMGNAKQGQGSNALNRLVRTYDDNADVDLLAGQRQQANEINQSLYATNSNVINDYNEGLLSNQSELNSLVAQYLADYNNLLGSTTTQRNQTNETQVTDTTGKTETDSTQTTSTSGNDSDSTVTSKVNSTNEVTNNATGNNKVTQDVLTDLSDYLNGDKQIDYTKLANALGLKNLSASGSSDMGNYKQSGKLQQQNNYRTPADRAASLQRRYG